MKGFKKYSEYKASSVEWLGEIPREWEVKRLKFVAPIIKTKLNNKPDEIPYIALEHIESNTGRLTNNEESQTVESSVSLFHKGDILFGKLRPYLNKVVHVQSDGACSSELVIFRTRENTSSRYLFYTMLSKGFVDTVNAAAYGVKMPRATPEQIGNMRVGILSFSKQEAIADFLDERYGRIDELIKKKERLIELLKEKRTAIISRAVTKGLDPNAKMRDSGIDWLGEIPEHWKVKRLKHLFRFDKGRNAQLLTKEYVASNLGDFSVYSGQTENDGILGQIDSYEYDTGEVIFVTTVGAKAMTTKIVSGKYSLSQNCALLIPRSARHNVRYFEGMLQQVFRYEKGSISLIMQPSLRFEDLNKYNVLCPPLEEQEAIANYLDCETGKIDALINKVQEAIAKLKEYRSAIITAAVTGKIDVREN